MPLVLATLSTRIKVLGKDSNDQYSSQRTEFLKDIVREMTTTFDWKWLYKIQSITVTATWQNLPATFQKSKGVIDSAGKRIRYISEEDYFIRREELNENGIGYYRLQWDDTNAVWQINFVNVTTGTVVELLYKWWTDDVTKMPTSLEEPIVIGALAKFMAMMEGDDAEMARQYRNDFVYLIQQHKFGDNDTGDGPQRMKTNAEIEGQEAVIRWNDQG